MQPVFDHLVDLENPACLAGNEFVLKLPRTPGGFGVGVGSMVNGKALDENTLDHSELVMPHVAF
jgi:hypothetical protein